MIECTINFGINRESFIRLKGEILESIPINCPGEESNKNYIVKSFSAGKISYTVNPYQMICTCPDFTKNRIAFEKTNIKRLCKHLKEVLANNCESNLNSAYITELLISFETIRTDTFFIPIDNYGDTGWIVFRKHSDPPTFYFIIRGKEEVRYPRFYIFDYLTRWWKGGRSPFDKEKLVKLLDEYIVETNVI